MYLTLQQTHSFTISFLMVSLRSFVLPLFLHCLAVLLDANFTNSVGTNTNYLLLLAFRHLVVRFFMVLWVHRTHIALQWNNIAHQSRQYKNEEISRSNSSYLQGKRCTKYFGLRGFKIIKIKDHVKKI